MMRWPLPGRPVVAKVAVVVASNTAMCPVLHFKLTSQMQGVFVLKGFLEYTAVFAFATGV